MENNSLVRSIINSRLEEIVELLFLDCPLIDSDLKNNKLKLYFTGNGSKVLNENLLSFGPEFNFISDMSIIVEEKCIVAIVLLLIQLTLKIYNL